MSLENQPTTSLAKHVSEWGQPIGRPVGMWRVHSDVRDGPLNGHYCRLEKLALESHGRSLYDANQEGSEAGRWTYLPYGPFTTRADYEFWVRDVSAREDPYFFAVIDGVRRRAVGVASYLRINPLAGSIEVGHIHYSPLLQESIAGTEAMYLMMKRAFEAGFRRYEWKCDALNQRSRAAALRLGFSFEGIFRQATVYKGRNRDTAWYSIIDSEWPALQAAFVTWLDDSNFDCGGRQRLRLSQLTASAVR